MISTLYNSLAKEKISTYGTILEYYYNHKSWLGDEAKIKARKLGRIAVEQGIYNEYAVINKFAFASPALRIDTAVKSVVKIAFNIKEVFR